MNKSYWITPKKYISKWWDEVGYKNKEELNVLNVYYITTFLFEKWGTTLAYFC